MIKKSFVMLAMIASGVGSAHAEMFYATNNSCTAPIAMPMQYSGSPLPVSVCIRSAPATQNFCGVGVQLVAPIVPGGDIKVVTSTLNAPFDFAPNAAVPISFPLAIVSPILPDTDLGGWIDDTTAPTNYAVATEVIRFTLDAAGAPSGVYAIDGVSESIVTTLTGNDACDVTVPASLAAMTTINTSNPLSIRVGAPPNNVPMATLLSTGLMALALSTLGCVMSCRRKRHGYL